MKGITRTKLLAVVQRTVQNMIRHESETKAPACMGPFYQLQRPKVHDGLSSAKQKS